MNDWQAVKAVKPSICNGLLILDYMEVVDQRMYDEQCGSDEGKVSPFEEKRGLLANPKGTLAIRENLCVCSQVHRQVCVYIVSVHEGYLRMTNVRCSRLLIFNFLKAAGDLGQRGSHLTTASCNRLWGLSFHTNRNWNDRYIQTVCTNRRKGQKIQMLETSLQSSTLFPLSLFSAHETSASLIRLQIETKNDCQSRRFIGCIQNSFALYRVKANVVPYRQQERSIL